MSDHTQHLTVADLRRHLKQIARAFDQLEEYAAMYGEVYADDISEELALSLRSLAADSIQLAGDHEVAHKADAEFADEVNQTLDQLDVEGDLLAPEPFGWAPEAHDLVRPVDEEDDK